MLQLKRKLCETLSQKVSIGRHSRIHQDNTSKVQKIDQKIDQKRRLLKRKHGCETETWRILSEWGIIQQRI